MENIALAAGCFWGVEKYFQQISGVKNIICGYAGGNYANPDYDSVVRYRNIDNNTKHPLNASIALINHTEAINITYDSKIVSTKSLLQEFWQMHDPTQLNRQGNDIGNNYRSAIYWTTIEQQKTALATQETYQQLLACANFGEIVTQITKLDKFWQAEEEHQQYLQKNPYGYCPNHSTGVKFKND